MILYAATWGISGPSFLRVYLAVCAVVLVGALIQRRRLSGGRAAAPASLGPQAAAYLNGGAKLAVYSSLAALRTAEAISIVGDRLQRRGPLPAGATALDRAVHHAADQRVRPRDLAHDDRVAEATRGLRAEMEEAGLVPTAEQLRAWRTGPWLLLALLAVGLARTIAGIANGNPVGYLVLTLLALGVVTAILFIHTITRTRAGDEALKRMREQSRYLSPSQHPSWHTYGPVGAGMGVALFGTAALWAADPAFASASEAQRHYAGAGGSYSGDGGGHYGGDGGGGGGGCGGGGGGGGCGG